MSDTPRGRAQDGTAMPHSVACTPPNERVSEAEQGAERFLTEVARHSKEDGIRGLFPLEKPGVVSFVNQADMLAVGSRYQWFRASKPVLTRSAGRPNPETYPFEAMTLTLRTPLEERLATKKANGHANGTANGVSSKDDGTVQVVIDGEDLNVALQYGPSAGLVKLRHAMEDIQAKIHKREPGDWAVTFGSGTQDLMYKTFQAVLEEGDPVLCETPLYAGVLPALRAKKADCIEVEIDDGGLSPKNLERILREWPADKKRPRCVYTNPIGCNPSGCSASRERKLEILEICKRYDVLIIEDDPYYFLTTPLIPSYFELEPLITSKPSRVIRFDSFSKLFSGGMRLGYATGPKAIVQALDVVTSGTNLHTSNISQIVAYKLIEHWGVDGFMSHSRAVAAFYAERRHWYEALAHKYLDGLASWVSPVAGMFLWIDVKESGIEDTEKLILEQAIAKGVLAVPGFAFYPIKRKSSHLRVSFSIIDKTESELGLSRLAEAIREAKEALQTAA